LQEKEKYTVVKSFKNGGKYKEHVLLDKTLPDYKMVKNTGIEFARAGKQVKALPRVHVKSEEYKKIFGALEDTKYYKKCPDLLINGKFYEVENFIPPFSKKKLYNMISRGIKQSPYIILNNNKGISHRIIKKTIYHRIDDLKQNISEVWVYEKGKIFQIY
jgi:hypothetical protein